VSNSSFLNGDVGITGLMILNFSKQIIVSPSLVCVSYCSLLLFCASTYCCSVLVFEEDIVYIFCCLSLEVHCNTYYELALLSWVVQFEFVHTGRTGIADQSDRSRLTGFYNCRFSQVLPIHTPLDNF
jgi:hypothetical protein